MDNRRKKTKKKNKKILAAAMVVAFIIVMGATFAVFTSKDEVTNRLSSTSDYNVTITENYEPTTTIIPGTTVTKKVAAVNTGSVDAFVKMTVSGQLVLTTLDSTGDSSYDDSNVSNYIALTDDEVTSLQAGAILAYTTSSDMSDTGAIGTLYTDGTGFSPSASGFFVFARSVEVTSGTSITYTWEYVGYYYDGSSNYYEISVDASSSTINSNGTITGTGPNLSIDKTTTTLIDASNLVFAYSSSDGVITATYDPDGMNQNADGDEIIININLASSYSTYWDIAAAADAQSVICYYKYVLESAATSELLIASVELDDSVAESTYISFDFDLNISLDSIQVASDDDDTTNGGYAATVNATSDTSIWTKKASGVWDGTSPDKYSYANGDSATSITWSARD